MSNPLGLVIYSLLTLICYRLNKLEAWKQFSSCNFDAISDLIMGSYVIVHVLMHILLGLQELSWWGMGVVRDIHRNRCPNGLATFSYSSKGQQQTCESLTHFFHIACWIKEHGTYLAKLWLKIWPFIILLFFSFNMIKASARLKAGDLLCR